MYWIDGADEVLGRRRELDSVYCLLAALRSRQQSGTAAGSLAGIEGAWCNIVSFLLVPRPPHVDRLKIPAGDEVDVGALIASLSDWDACVEERVTMERSLSEEWSASETASSDGEDASSPLQAELQFVRDQYHRSGLLLDQLNLPCSLDAMQRACCQEEAHPALESVLRSKEGLVALQRDAFARGRSLSAILAG
mmetsp:Transcript_11302/g.28368  ORF Transcript_11302/g.28368 Transcript_11302/m.28368 type:complete len:194 (+) Transcript_11302:64-645(+)